MTIRQDATTPSSNAAAPARRGAAPLRRVLSPESMVPPQARASTRDALYAVTAAPGPAATAAASEPRCRPGSLPAAVQIRPPINACLRWRFRAPTPRRYRRSRPPRRRVRARARGQRATAGRRPGRDRRTAARSRWNRRARGGPRGGPGGGAAVRPPPRAPAASASRRSRSSNSGSSGPTSSLARSSRTPVGSPCASRTIRPPGGSGVSAPIPARSSTEALAQPAWPSTRLRYTNRPGRSMAAWPGNVSAPQAAWLQPLPSSQPPGAAGRAASSSRRAASEPIPPSSAKSACPRRAFSSDRPRLSR